jgi:hypothetical protein
MSSIDRRSLLLKSSTLGIVAATGALAQRTMATPTAAVTNGGDGKRRRERLRERLEARHASRARPSAITPDAENIAYFANGTPQQVLDIYLPKGPIRAGLRSHRQRGRPCRWWSGFMAAAGLGATSGGSACPTF